MLVSCSKCGKIHAKGNCSLIELPHKYKRNSQADKFRNRKVWRKKSEEILDRDFHCCRLCYEGGIVNSRNLSVHHIIPLVADFDRRLDNDNLITLCSFHHELAEKSRVKKGELVKLATTPIDFTHPPSPNR